MSGDKEALLKAIAAKPDEDTPRLAYADWLDEYGSAADKARAEFIRVQVEIARGGFDRKRGTLLRGRERELLKAHGNEWVKADLGENHGFGKIDYVKTSGRSFFPQFHRGFISGISCNAAMFRAHADEWFARAPIQMLKLRRTRFQGRWGEGATEEEIHQELLELRQLLSTSPHMQRLSFLSLEHYDFNQRNMPLDQRINFFADTFNAARFPKLKGLDLPYCYLNISDLRLMTDNAPNSCFPALKKLCISPSTIRLDSEYSASLINADIQAISKKLDFFNGEEMGSSGPGRGILNYLRYNQCNGMEWNGITA